jgi:RNA-dependent RNA polymerase
MNLEIANLDFGANEWDVTKAVAGVLHKEDEFLPTEPTARLLNFKVKLNPRNVGVQNDGTGILTLPSHEVTQILWSLTWSSARFRRSAGSF